MQKTGFLWTLRGEKTEGQSDENQGIFSNVIITFSQYFFPSVLHTYKWLNQAEFKLQLTLEQHRD